MTHQHEEQIGPELTGLQPVELSLADHIPSGGEAVLALWEILPQLPGQVIQIAHQLPDVLHVPQLEDREMGA